MAPNGHPVSEELEEERKIKEQLASDPEGTTARYFRKIDLMSIKLDQHCKHDGEDRVRIWGYIKDGVLAATTTIISVLVIYLGIKGII
jgi:hypothetical protein